MDRKRLRVIFFGTAEFAVPCLAALMDAGHEILAVVTQPDKPQGRGQQIAVSPVKKVAEKFGLPVLQPKRVRAESFLTKVREMQPDVLALAAFGQVIPQALLDIPPLGPINVHGSLLPKYRGAAPIQRAIIAGETVTGVTTMWMDASLDTGDMLLEARVVITEDDTTGTLTPKLAETGAELLLETLEGLSRGTIARRPQDHTHMSLAPAIKPEDSLLDWTEPATSCWNRVRGLSPKPGVYTEIKGKRVKVWNASPVSDLRIDEEPGTLIQIAKNPTGVLVAAGEGTVLLLTETQPDSGKRMPAADMARGMRLTPGDRFLKQVGEPKGEVS